MPYQVPVEGREEKAAGAVRVEVHGALVPLALLWVDATRAHRRAHLGSMSWDQCYDPRLSQRRVLADASNLARALRISALGIRRYGL